MCHFIFDYNSGFSWSIFIVFLYQWKQEGILYKEVNKIYHFTLTVSPHYLVKLKRRKTAYFKVNHQSNWLFATLAASRPMFVFSNFFGTKFFYQYC